MLCLSWEVDNWQYDTWYTVTIDNIRYQSSETISIHYDVLIDYKNIIDINFPLEAGKGFKSARRCPTAATVDRLKASSTKPIKSSAGSLLPLPKCKLLLLLPSTNPQEHSHRHRRHWRTQ
jgi:hypothetical protein